MERARFALQLPSKPRRLVRQAAALGLVVIGAEQQRDETDCTSRANLNTGATSTQRLSTTTSTPVDPQLWVSPVDSTVYEDCMRTRGYERITPTN